MLEGAIREVEAVGRAQGVALPENILPGDPGADRQPPPATTASMQRDIIEGRISELESQTGAVVRLGREKGILTPVHTFIYAALLPQEQRARRLQDF